MSYEDIEYSDEEVRDMEILENVERKCGLTLPKWEQELIEECIEEDSLRYAPEGNYRDFPGEERCFDWEAQDEMYREDAMSLR